MRHFRTFPLLSLLILCPLFPLVAQSFQVGGRVGAHLPETQTSDLTSSTAGMFAGIKAPRFRLGLNMELNYIRRPETSATWQMPLQGTMALDRQRMVEVHAGPYVGHNPQRKGEPRFQLGFSTGLQFNLPLSRELVLVSKASADQPLPVAAESHSELAPSRNVSFRISLGLAYRLRRGTRPKAIDHP